MFLFFAFMLLPYVLSRKSSKVSGDDIMGFSFKSAANMALNPVAQVKKVAQVVKKNPAAAKAVLSMATKYGKALPPPYGTALAVVSNLQKKAQSGDAKSIAKIAAIAKGAAAGNPAAIANAQLLQAANASRQDTPVSENARAMASAQQYADPESYDDGGDEDYGDEG